MLIPATPATRETATDIDFDMFAIDLTELLRFSNRFFHSHYEGSNPQPAFDDLIRQLNSIADTYS